MAHKKGQSSTKNGRDSNAQYRGVKVFGGQTVSAGQLIGQVSDTGRAFGTHLHLEIYVNGSWVDAEGWLVANAH